MSQFFPTGGQSIRASASASVLPMNTQGWFPLWLTGWISLSSKGLSRVFSNTSLKASVLRRSAFFVVELSHPHMTTGKTVSVNVSKSPVFWWSWLHKEPSGLSSECVAGALQQKVSVCWGDPSGWLHSYPHHGLPAGSPWGLKGPQRCRQMTLSLETHEAG